MKKIKFSMALILLVITISTYINKNLSSEVNQINEVDGTVEINELVDSKIYQAENNEAKKEINDISYEDLKNIKISKNKFKKVMEYKEFMGAIKDIKDLRSIKRFTEADVKKLEENFKDTKEVVSYKSHNINDLNHEQLAYIGLSKQSIKKLENKKIKNMIELKELIKEDYKNIKGAVEF